MAYGSHRRRRERDSDIRDVVEDAARDAGLSVPEFIEAAMAEHEESQSRRRPPSRALRLVPDAERPLDALERRISGRGQDDISEDRIADILGQAFNEIKASEQRTARLIESLSGLKPAANAARPTPHSVADVLASADRRTSGQPPAATGTSFEGFAARMQATISRQEVEAALAFLERKLALVTPRSHSDQLVLQGIAAEIATMRAVVMAEGALVPLAAIEQPLQSLTERIMRLAVAPAPEASIPPVARPPFSAPAATPVGLAALERRLDEVTHSTTSMVAGIQDELVRLGKHGLKRDDIGVDQSFDRLENRIQQLEVASDGPLGQIREDMRRLQASVSSQTPDPLVAAGLSALETKLDRIAGGISAPLRMVHNAVTQLARQRQIPGPEAERLDQLFAELAALKRGMADQSVNAGMRGMAQALVSISERIDRIGHRMQQEAETEGQRDPRRKSIDEEIDEIKELLKEAKAPCDDTKVLEAIGQLERKIAALENSPQALMERLDRLHERLDERPAMPAGSAASSSSNTDILLRNLAARMETMSMASAPDDRVIQQLQQEIRGLAGKIDQMPAAMPVSAKAGGHDADQAMLTSLLHQFEGLRADVGHQAARAAAQAVRELGTPAPIVLPNPTDTAHLESAISELRRAQSTAEERTTRTLEALHDTMHRVVDRLAQMQEPPARVAQPVAMPPAIRPAVEVPFEPPMAPPAMVAPVPRVPEPVLRAEPVLTVDPAPRAEPVPRAAPPAPVDEGLLPADILQPRAAAVRPDPVSAEPAPKLDGFAATLASMRTGQPKVAPREEAASSRSAVASAFAAAKDAMANLRASRAVPDDASTANGSRQDASQPQTATYPALDLPLEPGSGRPTPQAASRPAAGAPAAAAPMSAPHPQPTGDPKADFLAAARRAAQAAAQQQAAVSEGPKDRRGVRALLGVGKTGPAPAATPSPAAANTPVADPAQGVPGSGFRVKHAALLGTAALIVAVGAGYTLMSGGKSAETTPQLPPPRTSSIIPPAPQAAPTQQQLAMVPQRPPQAEAPRQILPQALPQGAPQTTLPAAAFEPSPAMDAPSRVAQPQRDEQLTVGSVRPQDRVPSGTMTPIDRNDPLFRFEGLKDAPRLREAALRGDPSALFEVGQRYADGRGAPRDPKTAALWFERAAENGFAPAQYRLGTMHREGRGVERSAPTALKHFQAAAEAGNARAMHNTAVLMAEGVKGAPDYAAAGEWFRKAAEFGVRDSQYNLAILHARGLGVSQDLTAAYAWFSAAAIQGDEDAAKKRDEVGSRLTPERLQQARAAAQQWKAKTPNPDANEATAPPGGWDTEARQIPATAPKPGAKRP